MRNYAKELRIVKQSNRWDAKELYEKGALAGKYNGNQLFAALDPRRDLVTAAALWGWIFRRQRKLRSLGERPLSGNLFN